MCFAGVVVKGFDLGIASMKKGEKAVLTFKPDYAYGSSGSPPNIPPNATLIFEVMSTQCICLTLIFIELYSNITISHAI